MSEMANEKTLQQWGRLAYDYSRNQRRISNLKRKLESMGLEAICIEDEVFATSDVEEARDTLVALHGELVTESDLRIRFKEEGLRPYKKKEPHISPRGDDDL